MWKAFPAGIACDKKATEFGVCRPAAKVQALRQREDNSEL